MALENLGASVWSVLGREAKGRPMRRAIVLVAVIGSLALAFSLVWMNRYRYQQHGVQIVRVNRFTSQVCYSQNDGTWNSNVTAPPKWLAKYMRDPAKWETEEAEAVKAGKEITFSPADFAGTNGLDMKQAAENFALNTCK
jgi:hypothetical protein